VENRRPITFEKIFEPSIEFVDLKPQIFHLKPLIDHQSVVLNEDQFLTFFMDGFYSTLLYFGYTYSRRQIDFIISSDFIFNI
jgi:hypothetical protein